MRIFAAEAVYFQPFTALGLIYRPLFAEDTLGILQILRRGGLPVCLNLILLLANGLEKEHMAANVDVGLSDLPKALPNIPPLNIEGAAFVELAQQAEADMEVFRKRPAKGVYVVAVVHDDHGSSHGCHHA